MHLAVPCTLFRAGRRRPSQRRDKRLSGVRPSGAGQTNRITMRIASFFSLMAFLVLGACAVPPPPPAASLAVDPREIAALEVALRALGADVDPQEAARAARIAHEYPRYLAVQYQISDPPLIHNTKVNLGLRSRGLCWHWAKDMETRMRQEGFQTREMQQAVANTDRPFRLQHSTLVISRRGDGPFEGIVLDPWRNGGLLFWAPMRADPDYVWRPRREVYAKG